MSALNSLHPATQIVFRNLGQAGDGSLLVVDPPDAASASAIDTALPAAGAKFLLRDYSVYREIETRPALAARARFEAALSIDEGGGAPETALVYLLKGIKQLEMTLSLLPAAILERGKVMVTAENKAGVGSCQTLLRRLFDKVAKVDAARHCSFWVCSGARPVEKRHVEDWEERWPLAGPPRPLEIVTLPGVFSFGRLDRGTALLLETLPSMAGARILDVGCGCGVIAARIAAANPDARIEGVDSSALALASCARVFQGNGLANAQCYPSDMLSRTRGKYDWIVSNPPFHEGVHTQYTGVARMIEETASRLAPGGRLSIVANRFLPYLDLLNKWYRRVSVVEERDGFRVYLAAEPAIKG